MSQKEQRFFREAWHSGWQHSLHMDAWHFCCTLTYVCRVLKIAQTHQNASTSCPGVGDWPIVRCRFKYINPPTLTLVLPIVFQAPHLAMGMFGKPLSAGVPSCSTPLQHGQGKGGGTTSEATAAAFMFITGPGSSPSRWSCFLQ